jgi:molybdopterin molybdotransferase
MIPYEDALALLVSEAHPQPVHNVARDDAIGLICAQDLVSGFSIPPFDNSAMDGFAVHAEQTASASASHPVTLSVGHHLAAGDLLAQQTRSAAVQIMTGAKMPAGFDAVVPIEDVDCVSGPDGLAQTITLRAPVVPGRHIRRAAEDFAQGALIACAGQRLHSGHIAAMAATGIQQLGIVQMPGVEVFATGQEVVDANTPTLADGQIYDSNTPYLLGHLRAAGIPAHRVGRIGDDPHAFARLINAPSDHPILISTGAVSKGTRDFIPEVLQQHGARLVFHRVAIKPGKPILFARLANGRYFFGLPGNPVSAAVGLRFFVQPLIRRLLGMPPETLPSFALEHNHAKKGRLRHFLKARVHTDVAGQSHLHLLDGQESFKISPMLHMNCWAIIDESSQDLSSGNLLTTASVDLFPPLS